MSFLQTLQNTIQKVATLSITTIVGEAQLDEDGTTYKPVAGAKVMQSSIDLLEGDITSIIPEDFLKEPYASLREYHQAREDMGRAIIKENIECLKSLVELVQKLGESKT
jgi:hypothetical protein